MTASVTADALGLEIAEIDQRLAAGWSLPTRCYWDTAVFDFEMDAIFGSNWLYFGPVQKLANPGDIVVRQMGKYPVVATRDRNGDLHAFLNVCRHRGYTVAERDQSKRLRLVCRYHAWSYNLDGTLADAPDASSEPGFCRGALRLQPVAIDRWGPALFVNPDPGAGRFRDCHPGFLSKAEELGFAPDPERYALSREITYDIPTNWKLWYDNGTECYHCPNIHGSSFGDAFSAAPEDNMIEHGDRFMTNHFKPGRGKQGNGLTSRTFRSFQLFPGTVLIEHDDMLHMTGMVPVAPGVTRHITHYLGDKESDPARISDWIDLWDMTYREDNEVTAKQYENLKCGRQPWNRYVAGREMNARHFNQMTWDAYKAALAA